MDGLDDLRGHLEDNTPFDNWYEHILLKLHSKANNRTHFPVVIPSTRSYYLHKDIYNMTNVYPFSYPTIDFN